MSKLALRIVCRTLFSAEVDAEADEVGEAVSFANEFGESAYFLPPWLPTPKNRELARTLARLRSAHLAHDRGAALRRGRRGRQAGTCSRC